MTLNKLVVLLVTLLSEELMGDSVNLLLHAHNHDLLSFGQGC